MSVGLVESNYLIFIYDLEQKSYNQRETGKNLILIYDLEQKSYNQSETGKKALGIVTFIKQPKFSFYLHFLQDLVENMRPVSLKFQQNDLLSCEMPRMLFILNAHMSYYIWMLF